MTDRTGAEQGAETVGALAALDLLKRGWATSQGEENLEETIDNIRDGIEADGLAVVIRRQYDFEHDPKWFSAEDREDAGPFPETLQPFVKATPKTVWKP